MSDLIAKYTTASGGDEKLSVELMARDLMRSDSATFKAGYSAGNAAKAALEAFRRTSRHFKYLSSFDEASMIARLEAWEEGRNDPAAAGAVARKLADAARALRREAIHRFEIADAWPDGMSAEAVQDMRDRGSELRDLASTLDGRFDD